MAFGFAFQIIEFDVHADTEGAPLAALDYH
jgi:hypothetical protein